MASKKTKPTPGAINSPELEEYIKKGKDSVNAWLAKYTLLLIGSGVERVRVEYSGQGDSGQIDSVACYDHGGGIVDNPFGSANVEKQFEEFLYNVLDVRGWEVNNEGSQGTIDWSLIKDEFVHHHEENIMKTDDSDFDDIKDLKGNIDPDNPS